MGIDQQDLGRAAGAESANGGVDILGIVATGVAVAGMAGEDLPPVVDADDALDVTENQDPTRRSAHLAALPCETPPARQGIRSAAIRHMVGCAPWDKCRIG